MPSRDAFLGGCSSGSSSSVLPLNAMDDEATALRGHIAHLILMTVLTAVANDVLFYGPRQPLRPDPQRSVKYIQELMGYDRRIFNLLRLNRDVFRNWSSGRGGKPASGRRERA